MSRKPLVLAALAAAAAGLATPALAASSKTVRVGDDFFAPRTLTVDKGTSLVFRWNAENQNPHDVQVTSAPSGVTKWRSQVKRTNYTFRRTVTKAGTYKLICSIHPTMMRLTVRVRR
jgi:plastocyanin